MNLFKSNNSVIQYTINKELGSNCYISVDGGEVVVSAPWYFSRKHIQTMIEEKKQWILEKIKEYQEQNNVYTNKGTISILGIPHQVRLYYKHINTPNINLVNNNIEVVLPNKYKKADTTQILKILVEKLYNKLAIIEIEKVMEKTRLMLGFAPEDYSIKQLSNNLLATCDTEKKQITINPSIVKYDIKTIEYIILHQFCHLKYKIHAKGFWQMVKKYMPDYKNYESIIN